MKRNKNVIVIQNVETLEYFFTVNHCQEMNNEKFVPCTHYSNDKEFIRERFYSDGKEINNPDPEYQA